MAVNVAGQLLNQQAQMGSQPPKAQTQGLNGPQVGPGPGGQVVPQAGGATPATQQGVGGATVTPITPQNSLRGQQITPGVSAQTAATQAMVGNAAQQVGNLQAQPISRYQQAAAPYQQQGQGLFNQAAGTIGQAQGYGNQAAQSIANTGFGQYGAIAPTVSGGGVSAQTIGGPSYQQGQVNLPGIQTGPLSGLRDLAFGGDTQHLRGQVGQGLDSLYTAPDRGQLASEQFKLLQEQAAPILAQQTRALGNATGAFGRMGSGLVNSQLADLGTAAATSRDQQARQLSLDAAGQTMADRLARVQASQSGLGQLAGLDTSLNDSANQNRTSLFDRNLGRDQAINSLGLQQANFNAGRDDARNAAQYQTQAANAGNALQAAGMNADLARTAFDQQANNRNFAFGADQARNNLAFDKFGAFRNLGNDALAQGQFGSGLADQAFGRGNTERSFLSNYDTNANQLAFNKLDSLAGLQGQQFGQDQTLQQGLRGERDYQDNLAKQAQDDAISQYLQEQASQAQDYNQWQGGVNTLGALGWQGDPTTQMNNEALTQQQQGQGSIDAFAKQLADQYATPSVDQQLATSRPVLPTWGPQYVNPPLDTSNIPSFRNRG